MPFLFFFFLLLFLLSFSDCSCRRAGAWSLASREPQGRSAARERAGALVAAQAALRLCPFPEEEKEGKKKRRRMMKSMKKKKPGRGRKSMKKETKKPGRRSVVSTLVFLVLLRTIRTMSLRSSLRWLWGKEPQKVSVASPRRSCSSLPLSSLAYAMAEGSSGTPPPPPPPPPPPGGMSKLIPEVVVDARRREQAEKENRKRKNGFFHLFPSPLHLTFFPSSVVVKNQCKTMQISCCLFSPFSIQIESV
jgi:hypothetical protein